MKWNKRELRTETTPPAGQNPGLIAFVCLVLTALTILTYWTVRHCDFIDYDDPDYVTANPHVRAGFTTEGVVWALRSTEFANWHPLTWLSHMLDGQIHGLNPAGHHLTNLLLHLANTLLLFGVLKQMTQALWRSAFVATLFALHPLHVESVAWVSERKDVLSTFFFMLTLWAYVRYTAESRTQKTETNLPPSAFRPLSSGFYWFTLFMFALGLMSKPMLVTLPFILLLLDFWPLKRIEAGSRLATLDLLLLRRLFWEKLPFFTLSIASSAVSFAAQHKSGVVWSLEAIPFHTRLANALISYAGYLGKMLWPVDLAVFYPYPKSWSLLAILVAGLSVVSSTVFVIWQSQRRPYLAVGWFWYVGMLVPVIGLVQVGGQAMADRYTYVPLIGIFIISTWGGYEVLARLRMPGVVIGLVATLIVIACSLRTASQLQLWRNNESLFQHALQVTKRNYIASNILGVVSEREGKLDQAFTYYQEALRFSPFFPDAYNNLGGILARQGRLDEAIAHFQQALRYRPNFCNALITLGGALTERGRPGEAITPLQRAVELQPNDVDAHYNLGNAWLALNRSPEAFAAYQTVISLSPGHGPAHYRLAGLFLADGNTAAATKHYRAALVASPNSATVHYQLATVLVMRQEAAEAIAHYREAIRLKPKDVDALNNLAWLLATHHEERFRNGIEAVNLAEQAVELTNNLDPKTLDTLAAAYAEAGRFTEATSTATRAVKLSATPTLRQLKAEIEARLRLYAESQPFHEQTPQLPTKHPAE